ncbi:nuclear transport factor 2 family protein [Streptomyces sp. ALI-76-A]|jgi:3-phenylpropionate/cinnamic acid dioxygenase small subunit|uniref:nuclear transport factor 2 family protein n=1 Tax=Streptomyces sp. ALI-76-A TaxID=3025736 RepID=UPI00256EA4F0|nr:nuclear transport factor 2 family protein [Streptomyces sp. ALI-76-A]MDL5205438.1 nuclear transport factor 2 family protein [Streptomyces sp. ALI-76-A]
MTVELVDTAPHTLPSQEFAALYAQVQQFYAHQMRILDAHDTERWAGTFTEDAVLELPALSEPVPARAGLARYARAGAARQRRAGGRLTHWVGMLDAEPQADGSVHTRCSALVYVTPSGDGPKVLRVCVMADVLVRAHGEWRIAHRRVTRDDLA